MVGIDGGGLGGASWRRVPFIAGGFVWTGFDYRGEPTPFNKWPNVASQFGIMDSCGFPKDNFYYYKAWWGRRTAVASVSALELDGGQTVNVWCHTNLDSVELFVNGQSQGVRDVVPYKHVEWDVALCAGLRWKRAGYKNGRQVLDGNARNRGRTGGNPTASRSRNDSADGEDVCGHSVENRRSAGPRRADRGNNSCLCGVRARRIDRCRQWRSQQPRTGQGEQPNAFNGLCTAIVQAAKTPGDDRDHGYLARPAERHRHSRDHAGEIASRRGVEKSANVFAQ